MSSISSSSNAPETSIQAGLGVEGQGVAPTAFAIALAFDAEGSSSQARVKEMDYKARFNPVEVLRPGGWVLMAERDEGMDQTATTSSE